MSITTRSGFDFAITSIASRAVPASPQTVKSVSRFSRSAWPRRIKGWSSTSRLFFRLTGFVFRSLRGLVSYGRLDWRVVSLSSPRPFEDGIRHGANYFDAASGWSLHYQPPPNQSRALLHSAEAEAARAGLRREADAVVAHFEIHSVRSASEFNVNPRGAAVFEGIVYCLLRESVEMTGDGGIAYQNWG